MKPGVIIHGGQAVLMNEFIKDADPIRIISYLDYNHTTNRATFMDALGYRELKPTGPSLIWSNPCLPMGDSKPYKMTDPVSGETQEEVEDTFRRQIKDLMKLDGRVREER